MNIGTIRGLTIAGWVGGIVGRDPYEVENCMNAGFVYSNGSEVGGIVGHCEHNRAIRNCLNTGVVHSLQPVGAIAGYMPNHSQLYNNYYDKQMCTKGGVDGDTNSPVAIGRNTHELIGKNPFGTQWQVTLNSNFYPVPSGGNAGVGNKGYTSNTPYKNEYVSKVAAAVIILQKQPIPPFPETTDNIIVHSFYAYHSVNSGVNRWTARNGSIIFAPPHTWHTSGPARKDTMVATCGNYSKFVPLNIPRAIYRLATETDFATNAFSASEVTPNIVTDNATIDIQTLTEGNLNVSIYDLAGTKVANITDKYVNANVALQVDLNGLFGLSAGSYMAVVSVGNEVIMRKFVKQ